MQPADLQPIEERDDGLVYNAATGLLFTGIYKKLKSTGGVEEEQHYREGYKHGAYVNYGEDGRVTRRTEYRWGEVVRDQRFYPSGLPRFDKQMREGKAIGLTREWHANGQLHKILTLSPGLVANGQVLFYDEEGRVVRDDIYHHGKLFHRAVPYEEPVNK